MKAVPASLSRDEETIARWLKQAEPLPDTGRPVAIDAIDKVLRIAASEMLAAEERLAVLERYIREGDKALRCSDQPAFGPPCGGCDGCITAQIIYGIKHAPVAEP